MGGEVCVTNGGDLVAKKLLLAHKTLPFVWCKWQEVQHYRESGLPSRAPNSMNNYGLVLNERHGCKQVAHGIEGKEICESSHHSSEFWDLWKWMTLVQCFAKDRFATSFLCAPERSSPSYRREARNVWHKGKQKRHWPFAKGLGPEFPCLLRTQRLFGSDEDRVTAIKGQETEAEDWGGSTLDDHHSFIVQYRPTDDKQLCGKIMASGITQLVPQELIRPMYLWLRNVLVYKPQCTILFCL